MKGLAIEDQEAGLPEDPDQTGETGETPEGAGDQAIELVGRQVAVDGEGAAFDFGHYPSGEENDEQFRGFEEQRESRRRGIGWRAWDESVKR